LISEVNGSGRMLEEDYITNNAPKNAALLSDLPVVFENYVSSSGVYLR
jgi:hypothetical protein